MWSLRCRAASGAALACIAASSPAGPIMLFGDAPEMHASAESYAGLLQIVLDNVTNGQTGILVIGADRSTPASSFALAMSAELPLAQQLSFINDQTIGVLGFSNYGLILVPSDDGSVEGGINADESRLLASRSADIGAFLDAGGGVFGFTQGEFTDPYGYLGGFAPSVIFAPGGRCAGEEDFDDVTPTITGGAFGIGETDFDGCCWQNIFSAHSKFLLPLAFANEPACPEIDGSATVLVAAITPPSIGFGPPQSFVSAGEPTVHATGDLDGDGDPDVAAAIPGTGAAAGVSGAVQVFLDQGTDEKGQWLGLGALEPFAVGAAPSGVAIGLLNGDTYLDLAVSNAGDNTVSVLLGNGDGTFGAPASHPTGNHPSSLAIFDANEDGANDLAISNLDDANVLILFGDGAGGFFPDGATSLIFSGPSPIAVTSDDLDNDKCLDMAGANESSAGAGDGGTVFVLLGLHGGGFSPVVFYPVGTQPTDVSVGDLNNDGSNDLVATDAGSASTYLLLNNGDGTFQPAVPLPVGTEPKSVDVRDLDNDGDKDLAVVADDVELGPSVQIVTNRLDGGLGLVGNLPVFDEPISLPIPAGPNFVASADFNADSYFDLVTVNAAGGAGTVTVLLNEPVAAGVGPCVGDVDGEGSVNIVDVLLLLEDWGPCPPFEAPCPADGDEDGDVDINDLLTQLSNFGQCPGIGCPWDIDGSGTVDGTDVELVSGNQGLCGDPKNCPWDLDHDGVVDLTDVFLVAINLGPCQD